MTHEYWATFSIFDHRKSMFRQALVLFDRIVVPVSIEPVGDQTEEELERLRADVRWLQEKDAARLVDWNPEEFNTWKNSQAAESISAVLNKDLQYATRLQLFSQAQDLKPADVDDVTAVPVYGTRQRYDEVMNELGIWTKLTMELSRLIDVPDNDVPLEDIIALREEPGFRDSMSQLHRWQKDILPKVLDTGREKEIRYAISEYERWIKRYDEAIKGAKFNKLRTAVISITAVGAALATGTGPLLTIAAAVAPPLFDLRVLMRPCWKEVAEKDCAPAGVVYEAQKLFSRY